MKIRLLLIEDDVVDQMAFRIFLQKEQLPYDFTVAGSVREACRILQDRQFDVIISDYNLGDGTAFDVFPRTGSTPVIIATGAGDEKVAVQAMKLGAYDYLIKDPDRNYLRVLPLTVNNALKLHRLEAARQQAEKDKEKLIQDLRRALQEVKTLSGLIPICANCKKVRDDSGYWTQVEAYISQHSEADFSHSICPECLQELYPQAYQKLKDKGKITDEP